MGERKQSVAGSGHGFSLIELMVVIAIIALLAAFIFPALTGSKEKARQAACLNNQRQLAIAHQLYVDDSQGFYYPRTINPCWMQGLLPYYGNMKILHCPSDAPNPTGWSRALPEHPADSAPRSYVINGWNDYFKKLYTNELDFRTFMTNHFNPGMPESAVLEPSETILFGEKETTSTHVYMDFAQGASGNDVEEIEQARHGKAGSSDKGSGSIYALCDGSARFIKFGGTLWPKNLWAVIPEWRTNKVVNPIR